MKKKIALLTVMMLTSVFVLGGCGKAVDPGTPPEEVINPETTVAEEAAPADASAEETETEPVEEESNGLLEGALLVKIGKASSDKYTVDMYDNDAANTMLNYVGSSAMLFPTHTYSDEESFVAEEISGEYSREDEVEITDIKAGELYLLSGNQLRLYYRDVTGANITATPVGYFVEPEAMDVVPTAYEKDKENNWDVAIYFWLMKQLQ